MSEIADTSMTQRSLDRRRLRALFALTSALSLCVALCAGHARSLARSRDHDAPALRATAAVFGPELALHAGARWLRHPTRSEPWAYGHDGPGVFDSDPAGAFAGPPREALVAGRGATVTHAALRHGPSNGGLR